MLHERAVERSLFNVFKKILGLNLSSKKCGFFHSFLAEANGGLAGFHPPQSQIADSFHCPFSQSSGRLLTFDSYGAVGEEVAKHKLSEVRQLLGTHISLSELGVFLMLAGNACRGASAWNDVEEICFWTTHFSLPEFSVA